jgi:colanic acid/amylovoran biosynthesis glycosyltransferase
MPLGPGEQFLIAEADELTRLGYDLVIAPRSPRGSVFNDDASALSGLCRAQSLLGARVLLDAALQFARSPLRVTTALLLLARSETASTFLKNLLVFPKSLWLARLARTWRAEHIHAHWGRTTGTMALVAGHVTGVPWSITYHSEDIAQPNLLDLKLSRAAFSRFISESGIDIAEKVGVASRRYQPCVIHVGVRLPAVHRPRARAAGPLVVLCPAYLYQIKGQRYLLEAIRLLRDRGVKCALVLAGDGPLRGELEALVEALGVADLVEFKGQVPHHQILEWYEQARVDVVALPSIDLGGHLQEGIPVALMEAMAYRIPVVSTSTGGIPELLGEGAGIVVPERDAGALADSLERLAADVGFRAEIGAAGRQRIEQHFDVVSTTARLAALIEGHA